MQTTVTVKTCRACGAQYSTSGSTFAARHMASQHPGENPGWKTRREVREVPSTITYAFGYKPGR